MSNGLAQHLSIFVLLKMAFEWKFTTWHIYLTFLGNHFYIANSSQLTLSRNIRTLYRYFYSFLLNNHFSTHLFSNIYRQNCWLIFLNLLFNWNMLKKFLHLLFTETKKNKVDKLFKIRVIFKPYIFFKNYLCERKFSLVTIHTHNTLPIHFPTLLPMRVHNIQRVRTLNIAILTPKDMMLLKLKNRKKNLFWCFN